MGLFDTTWSLQVEKILPPVMRDVDFFAESNDLKTGEADNNYIESIIVSFPGHWKEFPAVGVGVFRYLQGTTSPQVLQRNISLQLQGDVFTNPLVDIRRFPTIVVNRVTLELSQ